MLSALAVEDRVSVKSGHGVGKSCSAATAALWFKNTYSPSIVLTTAPTERQVKEILWREIRHRHSTATVELPGKPMMLKMELGPIDFMLGFSTNNVQQIQGFHSPNILIIIDEANGYPAELYDAIEGLLSGGERKILFQIGNPIEPVGPFFGSFSDGRTWTHTISCLNHPNVITGKNMIPGAVTKEWVDRIRALWGEDSAFWQSRVLGQFPRIAIDIVVQLSWVEKAEQEAMRHTRYDGSLKNHLGVDVAEYGGDDNIFFVGNDVACEEILAKRNIEPDECEGVARRLMVKYNIPPGDVTIDSIGVGYAVAKNFRKKGDMVRMFKGSKRAVDDKTYANAITEAWFNLRHLFNPESDRYRGYSFSGARQDRLKSDLCTRKYKTDETGRLKLEPKEAYRKRMNRSPDYGDGAALCYSYRSRSGAYGLVTLPNVIGD